MTPNPYLEARIAELEQQLRTLIELLRTLAPHIAGAASRAVDKAILIDDAHPLHQEVAHELDSIRNAVARLNALWPVEERR